MTENGGTLFNMPFISAGMGGGNASGHYPPYYPVRW